MRESHASLRRLQPEKRRRVIGQLAVTYLIAGAWVAVLVSAPFGRRATIIYFVIVPFVAVRCRRSDRRDRGRDPRIRGRPARPAAATPNLVPARGRQQRCRSSIKADA